MINLELVDPRHPALHTPAVVDPFDSRVDVDWDETEQAMFTLMERRMGIGLASPQVGLNYMMFTMTFQSGQNIGVYNPEILETSDTNVSLQEGCLTFPSLYLIITRPEKVKVRFQTSDQTIVEDWLEGMDARCFQHELDHLKGITYLEYASDMKLKRALKKREKTWKTLQTDLALNNLANES